MRNLGKFYNNEDGHTYIWIDGKQTWTYSWSTLSDTNFLNQGGHSYLQPQTLQGRHTVKACIDANNVVAESNENNNCKTVTVYGDNSSYGNDSPSVNNNERPEYEAEVITENINNPFSDVDPNSLEGKAAIALYNLGIIGGFSDGTFRGDKPVNRAEAAKFLLLSKYEKINSINNNGTFKDILDGQWYTKYVLTAAKLGIIIGYSNGKFVPGDTVNTAEFLKMLSKTFNLSENLSYTYDDVNSDQWFARYAGIAKKYQLFPNRYARVLSPGQELTRNDVAVAIYQYLLNK